MTTIAFDGKTLAADTRGDWCGLPTTHHKIVRCGEFVYGFCGNTTEIIRIQHWLALSEERRGPCLPAELELSEGGSWGIAIHESSGKLFRVAGRRAVIDPIWDCPTADGGGRDFALSAMHFGQSAEAAVRFAMRFSIGTGGVVDTYDVATKEIRFGVLR